MLKKTDSAGGIHLNLDNEVRDAVLDMVRDLTYEQTREYQNEHVIETIHRVSVDIPSGLKEELQRFQTDHEAPYIIVKNLPSKKQNETLLLLTHIIGFPFSHEREGELIISVKPSPVHKNTGETSYFTWNRFDLHSELPYVETPPDFLALWCIRNVKGANSLLSRVDMAIDKLTGDQLDELRIPQFRIPIPKHFSAHNPYAVPRPVIGEYKSKTSVRVRFDGLMCASDSGQKAIEAFRAAVENLRVEYELEPGSLLIINNHICMHGRSSFVPTLGEDDRELHRVYLISDLNKFGNRYNHTNRRISGF